MDREWQYDDPVVDEETGARSYTVRSGDRSVSFAIVQVEGTDGQPGWVMQSALDPTTTTNPDFEPFDTPEGAYQAGLRAVRQALGEQ